MTVNKKIFEDSSSEEELVKDNLDMDNTDTEDDEKDEEEGIVEQDDDGQNDEENEESDHKGDSVDSVSLTDNRSVAS